MQRNASAGWTLSTNQTKALLCRIFFGNASGYTLQRTTLLWEAFAWLNMPSLRAIATVRQGCNDQSWAKNPLHQAAGAEWVVFWLSNLKPKHCRCFPNTQNHSRAWHWWWRPAPCTKRARGNFLQKVRLRGLALVNGAGFPSILRLAQAMVHMVCGQTHHPCLEGYRAFLSPVVSKLCDPIKLLQRRSVSEKAEGGLWIQFRYLMNYKWHVREGKMRCRHLQGQFWGTRMPNSQTEASPNGYGSKKCFSFGLPITKWFCWLHYPVFWPITKCEWHTISLALDDEIFASFRLWTSKAAEAVSRILAVHWDT